jgi:hypothetical protein
MPNGDEHEVFGITVYGSTIENPIVALILSGGETLTVAQESAAAWGRRLIHRNPGDPLSGGQHKLE